ncbi:MAG TPA: DUF5995 family protein [Stenomitos sp.]
MPTLPLDPKGPSTGPSPKATMPGDRLEISRPLVVPSTATQPSLDKAIERLEGIERDLIARHDPRAVFVTTYLMQTRTTAEALQKPGSFEDPEFMNRLALRFVQYFLDAYDNYEQGNRDKVPAPWQHAFDLATSGSSLVMEDLILGINAHINYDLPRALTVVGGHTPAQQRDFEKYNQVLFANIQPVKEAIIDRYTNKALDVKWLGVADKLSLKLDDVAAETTFKIIRNQAWDQSQRLQAGDRSALTETLEDSMKTVKAIELEAKVTPFHHALAKARVF